MTDLQFKDQASMEQWLATVGLGVVKIAAMCSVMGWASPRGAVPYMQDAGPDPAWDLVLWALGDVAATDRMRSEGALWAPSLMSVLGDSLVPGGSDR